MNKYGIILVVVWGPLYSMDGDGAEPQKALLKYLAGPGYGQAVMGMGPSVDVGSAPMRRVTSLFSGEARLRDLLAATADGDERDKVQRAGEAIKRILYRGAKFSAKDVLWYATPVVIGSLFLDQTLTCLDDWNLRNCGTPGSVRAELVVESLALMYAFPTLYSLGKLGYCVVRSWNVKRALARVFQAEYSSLQ